MVRSLLEADCKEVVALGSKDGNLTVESEVVALFEKLTAKEPIDIVVHLAGLIGGIQANKSNPGQFFYTNLMVAATLSLLRFPHPKRITGTGSRSGTAHPIR
jgi:GDP-L-fucose synthase